MREEAVRKVLCQMAVCDMCWVSVDIRTAMLVGTACCWLIDDEKSSFLMAETGVF